MTNTCAHTRTHTDHKHNCLRAVCLGRNSCYTQERLRHAHGWEGCHQHIISTLSQNHSVNTLNIATHYQHLTVPLILGRLRNQLVSVLLNRDWKKSFNYFFRTLCINLFSTFLNTTRGSYSKVRNTWTLFFINQKDT